MSKQRFIKSVVKSAKTEKPALPWQRGTARAAMTAKRKAPESSLKRA